MDEPKPISVYGKSKWAGEVKIIESELKKYFIVRTSWLYGAGGKNFVDTIIRSAKERRELKIVDDQRGTPTWTDDLSLAIWRLLTTDAYGTYHFSNEGDCTWFEFAGEIVSLLREGHNLQVGQVQPIETESYPLPAQRPSYSVLSKQKIKQTIDLMIPRWQESLAAYIKSC